MSHTPTLLSLSSQPYSPCYYLSYGQHHILLDAPLLSNSVEIQSESKWKIPLFHLLPGQPTIIVSTSPNTLLTLPYLTEYSPFNGSIYTTISCFNVAKKIGEEIIQHWENKQKSQTAMNRKKRKTMNDDIDE